MAWNGANRMKYKDLFKIARRFFAPASSSEDILADANDFDNIDSFLAGFR